MRETHKGGALRKAEAEGGSVKSKSEGTGDTKTTTAEEEQKRERSLTQREKDRVAENVRNAKEPKAHWRHGDSTFTGVLSQDRERRARAGQKAGGNIGTAEADSVISKPPDPLEQDGGRPRHAKEDMIDSHSAQEDSIYKANGWSSAWEANTQYLGMSQFDHDSGVDNPYPKSPSSLVPYQNELYLGRKEKEKEKLKSAIQAKKSQTASKKVVPVTWSECLISLATCIGEILHNFRNHFTDQSPRCGKRSPIALHEIP